MMRTSASATGDLCGSKDSNLHPLVELAATHTREFECRLAAIQATVGVNASDDAAAADHSSAPKPSVDENRLAAKVMLALSKAPPGASPNLMNAERQVHSAGFSGFR